MNLPTAPVRGISEAMHPVSRCPIRNRLSHPRVPGCTFLMVINDNIYLVAPTPCLAY